jgi:hypothetical protein
VPGHFKKTVEFGVPRSGAAPGSLPLDLYLDDLDRLRVIMRDTLQDQPEASAEQLSRQIGESAGRARALLQQTDDVGRNLIGPLIERPLQVGGRTY